MFSIHVTPETTNVLVAHGRVLDLTEAQAERLDHSIHDALETVLAPHFAPSLAERDPGFDQVQRRPEGLTDEDKAWTEGRE